MSEIPRTDDPVDMTGGEAHSRGFDLEAGDFLRVLVDQMGIDVTLRLSGPNGEVLLTKDSPNGANGYEELVFIAPESGPYLFEIVSSSGEGRYQVAALEQRPATADDRDFVAADLADSDGRQAFRKRDFDASTAEYQQALETWTLLDLPRRQIDTLHGLCRVRIGQGRLAEATAFCEAALELYRAQDDRRGMDILLDRAGWVRLRRGQSERAIPLCEEALALYEARGFDRGAALALSHLGTAFHGLGQFQRALDAFERALTTNAHGGDVRSEATIRNDLANVLLDLHRPQEALEHSQRAVEIQRQGDDSQEHAIALEGLALAHARLGQLEAADEALAKAMRLAGDDATVSTLRSTQGFVHQRRGNMELAGESYDKALEIARKIDDLHAQAWILARLGHLHVESGEAVLGLKRFDKASEIFAEIGELRGQAAARLRSGEALRDLNRLTEARDRMLPALDFIEATRRTTDRRDYRTDYFAVRQDYYSSIVDVLLRLHDEAPADGHARAAFAVNERRLAREFYDTLAERRSLSRIDIDPALLAEERRLQTELSEASLLPRDDPNRDSQIERLVSDLRQAGARIRRAVFANGAPERPAVDVDVLCREVLDEETLLLTFALGKDRSVLWVVSTEAFGVHELPPRAEIERLAAAFSGKLARSDARHQKSAREDGLRLSRMLLGKVADQIAKYERLAVVTEGELQAVPFAALPEPGGAADAYLVRRHEIVALPSLTALATLRQARAVRPRASRGFALFADPVFGTDDPRLENGNVEVSTSHDDSDLQRSAERVGVDPYVRLPHTRREVENIHEILGGDVFLGFAASRESFLGAELGSYSGIHVASHAWVDPVQSSLSGLVLSLVDSHGQRQNGFVRAFEISRLELAADLVVLSACSTGRGRDLPGEGVQALSRAFLDAGAARVVFSLWDISDRATRDLMSRFYKALAMDNTPVSALKRAQVSMLTEPAVTSYYWAGFISVGDWNYSIDGGAL